MARLQKDGSTGAPQREPAVDEKTQKEMMAFYFKKQEEMKVGPPFEHLLTAAAIGVRPRRRVFKLALGRPQAAETVAARHRLDLVARALEVLILLYTKSVLEHLRAVLDHAASNGLKNFVPNGRVGEGFGEQPSLRVEGLDDADGEDESSCATTSKDCPRGL